MKKIYKKGNIINHWDNIISDKDWEKIYNEVRKEVISNLIKEKYIKVILKGDKESEIDKELKRVLNDDLSNQVLKKYIF